MAYNETQAEAYRAEAEKKLTSRGFFQMLFGGGSNRVEQAIEFYQKAGNLFKLAKNWLQAGTAYGDAGDLNVRNNNQPEAAQNYIDAANCFKKCDVNKAVKYMLKAIEIYLNLGKFSTAGRYHQMIGELLENASDMERATQHYEQAADYFRGEDNHTSANKCLLKVAEYAAITEEKYEKSLDIFQQIACFALASSLLRHSVKDYFLKASLCHILMDCSNVKNALNYYNQMYPAFEDTREYHLVVCLVESVENLDVNGFNLAIKKYDSLTKLSPWHVTILLRIKKLITDKPDIR